MTLRERAIALAERLNIAADERDIEEIERELEAVADEEYRIDWGAGCKTGIRHGEHLADLRLIENLVARQMERRRST